MITLDFTPQTTFVQTDAGPSLATGFNPEKNPDNSQGQEYQRNKKEPSDNDITESGDTNKPYAPIAPGGAAIRTQFYNRSSHAQPNLTENIASITPGEPAAMLRRRSMAYESMMQIY